MPSAYVQAQIDAALAENAGKRRNSSQDARKGGKPTTEPPKGIEARSRAKTEPSSSAPAKLKPRYQIAEWKGFDGQRFVAAGLTEQQVHHLRLACQQVGILEQL